MENIDSKVEKTTTEKRQCLKRTLYFGTNWLDSSLQKQRNGGK